MATARKGGSSRGIGAFRKQRAGRFQRRPRLDIATFGADNPDPDEVDRVSFLYRPHELLVRRREAPQTLPLFDKFGVRVRNQRLYPALGLVRYLLSPETNVPALVEQFRKVDGPTVAPHYVLTGEPIYLGGPAGFPTPDPGPVGFSGGGGNNVRVAVIDTGYFHGANAYLDQHCFAGPADDDSFDLLPADGYLDDESGHGTFIAGVVLQLAPDARVEFTKVLDSEGFGSEIDIASAIVAHRDADVINLSLGAFTQDDAPPVALTEALRQVNSTTAVIAAAGNKGIDRKMWPAAFDRVIGVGAVRKDRKTRADFSNYGDWVDACTVGVDIRSAYVKFRETGTDPARTAESFKGFALWSGTSFAAPQIAGKAAAQVGPGRSGLAAATQVVNAGTPVPDLGRFVKGL